MIVKRAIDIFIAGLGILLVSPLLLLAMMAIRVSMGSPVLFRQTRAGLRGKPFVMVKLRTMRRAQRGENGPEYDAARLTLVGRVLRATSIDELPTLWNVLRGDMTLVGPRPLLMEYVDRYTPQQARRLEAKPGITGWAQLNGRNTLSWERKFAMDVWYIENRSWMLDVSILARTLWSVLRREGVNQAGHATMPEFLDSAPHRPGPAAKLPGSLKRDD